MRVTLIAAQSLDGRITFHDSAGANFTSEADQHYFRETLATFDCSVMGGQTFRVSEKKIRTRSDDGRAILVMTRRAGELAALGGAASSGVLEFSSETPARIIASLRARGGKRCALLGGSQIYGAFLAAGVVDEVWLTLEPRIFGAGLALTATPLDVRLRFLCCENLSANTLLLKYEVIK